jgi:hypothetical protein
MNHHRHDRAMSFRPPSLFCLVALGWALAVAAEPAPPPPKLEPLPEAPPPPAPVAADPELEPQVTIIHRENETIEEFRVKGRLTLIKVTPQHGRPYFLVPADGAEGAFVRRDSLDSGLRVPLWLIYSF